MKFIFSLGLLSSILFVGEIGSSNAFAFTPTSKIKTGFGVFNAKVSSSELCFAKSHPEYTVDGEDGDEDSSGKPSSDYVVVDNRNLGSVVQSSSATPPAENKNKPEYGALSPGTVVQVQVGDVSLARKAWKKRRRTGSPLLIPCSVLNVDRQSMVRWNLIYLLEKFGQAREGGVELSATQLSKRYRTYLKSSLQVSFLVSCLVSVSIPFNCVEHFVLRHFLSSYFSSTFFLLCRMTQ